MNRILLIWDCDSSLKVYLLYVDTEKFEKIKRCHGRYINSNENEELLWLSEWLGSGYTNGREPIFQSGEKEGSNFPIVPESTLVVCGFAE